MEVNPYQPPDAETAAETPRVVRRQGDLLVVPHGAELPPRCVLCVAPATGYATLAIVLEKRSSLRIGLCARHCRRQRRYRTIAWLAVMVAGLAIPNRKLFSSAWCRPSSRCFGPCSRTSSAQRVSIPAPPGSAEFAASSSTSSIENQLRRRSAAKNRRVGPLQPPSHKTSAWLAPGRQSSRSSRAPFTSTTPLGSPAACRARIASKACTAATTCRSADRSL